ncbi:hypothetical protein D9C73_004775 [Collichthys lucidus]|uniref:Uncharacterized protein n=1 Tax=Collichthys lucidus TaxID=240159 RepID=A0A4U5UBG7_COLLU|nr:hypothetical protein D9C73_004775 [Collichthys lucidus]
MTFRPADGTRSHGKTHLTQAMLVWLKTSGPVNLKWRLDVPEHQVQPEEQAALMKHNREAAAARIRRHSTSYTNLHLPAASDKLQNRYILKYTI